MSTGSAGQCGRQRRSGKPPKGAERLLQFMLPDDVGECVSGDLAEIYEAVILPSSGPFGARLWYWRQVFCATRLLFGFRANRQRALEVWKGQIKMDGIRNQTVAYHSGIRIDKIQVSGAMGLLFVFATVLIFGAGILAVRELAAIAGVFGILGSGAVYYWHKRHAVNIRSLNLHGGSPPSTSKTRGHQA